MLKNLFKKKKSITKPNWLICTLPFIVLFELLAFVLYEYSSYSVVENLLLTGGGEQITKYTTDISEYGYDGFTDDELEVIANALAVKQIAYDLSSVITIDGQEICNSSYAMSALVSDDERALRNVDRLFVVHWDPETDANAQKLLDYRNDIGMFHIYMFHVEDYYVNLDTHTLYFGQITVSKFYGTPIFIAGTVDLPFQTEKVVDVIDLTPSDESLLEGLTHVDNNNYDDSYSLAMFNITGSAEGDTIDMPEYSVGSSTHHFYATFNDSYNYKFRSILLESYETILVLAALIIACIIGSIKYFKDKSTYSIFEYRRKTTNAMAHDLKTPLAIASLSVANLKEKLGNDPERAEYHANEIDESISYMDQLICNILDFSNSEAMDRKLTKENVDVGAELEAHKQDISKVLTSRKLKLDITGSATRATDRKIWNQALFNLIDNASRYASEDSTITVTLGPGEITIINSVDKDITNADKLLEPFVKGDDNRGENSGSGLGLAIADNNLRALGYHLKISCKDKKFIAAIK